MWSYTLLVKKLLVFFALSLIIIFSLSADKAFWSGDEDGFTAYTDKYTPQSVLSIKSGERTVTVKVIGKLMKTLPGRELGLTKEVLDELGLWGDGDEEVNVTLLKGAVKEAAEEETTDGSGWYSIELKSVEKEKAGESYKELVFNSLKPETEVSGNSFIFTLPYIAEYEIDDTLALIEKLGLSVENVRTTENPYLN